MQDPKYLSTSNERDKDYTKRKREQRQIKHLKICVFYTQYNIEFKYLKYIGRSNISDVESKRINTYKTRALIKLRTLNYFSPQLGNGNPFKVLGSTSGRVFATDINNASIH